jgi:ribonucleoside-triphosphate reductase (formate)
VIQIRCPYCQSNETKVLDKRTSDFDSTRRRRQCLSCDKRFTTYERVENIELNVIKKNGTKEPFNRQKLREGLLKACEKRPVSLEAIDKVVDEIEAEIRTKEEVPTKQIGELVIQKLKALDEVAYLRYTSVYKSFDNLDRFKKEIDDVKKRRDSMAATATVGQVTQVKKRDGRTADFDRSKVTEAIFKAAESVGGNDRSIAESLSDQAVTILNEKYQFKIPSVEDVQDIVEKVLIENGHATTAKAYILYRAQHQKIRETKNVFLDVNNTISEYMDKLDWRVQENSNEQYSFSGLLLHTAGKVISNYSLNYIYTPNIAEAHKTGHVHIHDLSHGFIGYCAGWSLKNLLIKGFGGIQGKVDCKPAKHMNTVVHQMVNYIGCLQMEFAGAQAFSSVDTLLAPFVKADKMEYKPVKQCMQQIVFSLNIPSRWGSQYPFSNLTFDWTVPEDMKDEKAIVGGKRMDFTYGDCQKEMDMINKAFLEVMIEGDAMGRIFSFPIPTYNLTKSFDWESENATLLFDLTAKYGTPYFQNYVGSDLNPRSIRAMCCRLNMNTDELMKRPGSMWGPGDSTGSIGVMTINLNRLAYEAKDKEEFFASLKKYMILSKDALEIKRKIIDKNLKNGLMPYTKRYLGTFKNHFSTIGLCGMNEACMNLLGKEKDIRSEEGLAFTIETLEFMRSMCIEFQKETNNLYNLEATPAESTSYRFARLDKKLHPDIITSGTKEPYLTNSTQYPVHATEDAVEALEHQNKVQPLYTGGTIFHTFLGERMTNGESCKKLVQKIAYNTRLPYFSITPTFSVCSDHGYIKGEHFKCPDCGNETEVYSRIVGYYRPIKNWNIGKQEEFKDRLEFKEHTSLNSSLASELAATISPKQCGC